MQNRPDKADLLEAIARFLEREVKPAIKDSALGFRVLVAANLAAVVAGEIQTEDAAGAAELERLAAILPDVEVDLAAARTTREGRRTALDRYNRELCARIREGRLAEERHRQAWDHVVLTLRGELMTSSPRFDTSADIE
jgi:hypothetical protein